MDYNSVQQALQEKYSTNLTDIYVPSMKKKLDFKSITVGEQKSLTKMIIDSDDNDYKMYQIILGLIKNNCVTDGFDISKLLEIDRIKILIELYQSNFYLDDANLTCENCNTINVVKTDYSKIIKILDNMDITPVDFVIGDITFTIAYPSVVRMSDYYKNMVGSTELGLDIYDVFISRLQTDDIDITFDTITEVERQELLNIIPQEVFYGSDGLIAKVEEHVTDIFKTLTDDVLCTKCGHELSGGITIRDFFI